uniref:Retrotransposon gag domain-containing protein n=1 Tax=Denticeps clupeoides TaxID=299321 RepID=A0AAY4BRS2_9TELE
MLGRELQLPLDQLRPHWFESFSTYLTAVGLADSPDQRLRALLLHNLGTEGQRIFRTLGADTTYADGDAKLAAHFAAPQSVILRRVVFRQRRQQPGKSVHHYMTDLQVLASFCKFGTMEDEFIRDQLAEHTNNPRIREKFIMSSDDLTLAIAVELAFQMESAAELTSRLAPVPSLQPAVPTLTVQPPALRDDTPDHAVRGSKVGQHSCCP